MTDAQHITLRLPAHLVTELRAVATENERSLSAEARLALRAWLENLQGTPATSEEGRAGVPKEELT